MKKIQLKFTIKIKSIFTIFYYFNWKKHLCIAIQKDLIENL